MTYKVSCTFRLFSNLPSLSDVATLIGMNSDGGYEKGERISKNNSASKRHNSTLWTLTEEQEKVRGEDSSEMLEKALHKLLHRIEPLMSKLTAVPESEMDIYVGIFSESEQLNSFVSQATIKKLSEIGVDIYISGYAKAP